MGEAFDRACKSLRNLGSAVPEIIAYLIIQAAKTGERDPARLYEQVLNAFSIEDMSMPVVSVGSDLPVPAYCFGHANSVILREPARPNRALTWLFWCVFKLSTPRHLKCQMPRQTKPGLFYFRGRFAGSPLMAQSRHSLETGNVRYRR
jgi:hypothetical protein